VRTLPRQATRRSWTSTTRHRSPRRLRRTSNSTLISPSRERSRSCDDAPRAQVPAARASRRPSSPTPPPRPPRPPSRASAGVAPLSSASTTAHAAQDRALHLMRRTIARERARRNGTFVAISRP
jgi:hypothetical protein